MDRHRTRRPDRAGGINTIALAAARIALPIASAWYACRGTPASRIVVLYRIARDTRRARKLLRRASRVADRDAFARSRRLTQRAAVVLDRIDARNPA